MRILQACSSWFGDRRSVVYSITNYCRRTYIGVVFHGSLLLHGAIDLDAYWTIRSRVAVESVTMRVYSTVSILPC
uniref:Uncharacterized protein n=1 Tax=Babesia bovis TaxID=5865 RepID=S6BN30_BABBO|nr:hypothetical protein [Babesia bovis]